MSERTELPQVELRPDRCGTCRFWDQWEEDDQASESGRSPKGHCHRHAPAPRPFSLTDNRPMSETEWTIGETEWPNTQVSDWCGEWQPALTGLNYPAFRATLSVRLAKVLDKVGVRSFADLLRLQMVELYAFTGFGKTVEIELAEKLAAFGLAMRNGVCT